MSKYIFLVIALLFGQLQGKLEEEPIVSITFDDQWLSVYENALPEMEKRGYFATFYVYTNDIGKSDRFSKEQIIKLHKNGHEIGSHTLSHSSLDSLTSSERNKELSQGKQILEELLDAPVLNFAAPFGEASRESLEDIRRYFQSNRSADDGLNDFGRLNPYWILVKTIKVDQSLEEFQTWLDEAKRKKAWLVLSYHQVDNGGGKYSVLPDVFAKHMEMINAEGIPVLTVQQVMEGQKIAETAQVHSFSNLVDQLVQVLEVENKKTALSDLSYKKIISMDFEYTPSLVKLIMLYRHQGDIDKAIELSTKSIKAFPKRHEYYVQFGYTYLIVGDYELSRKGFEKAWTLNQTDPDIVAGLGRVHFMQGEVEEAEKFYGKALEMNPEDITTLFYLVDLNKQRNNDEEVTRLYEKILSIEPQNQEAYTQLQTSKSDNLKEKADQLVEEQKWNEAAATYEKLIILFPEDADVLLSIAQTYEKQEQWDISIEYYERALAIEPQREDIKFNLAIAYQNDGQEEKSITLLREIIIDNPQNKEALRSLGFLYEGQEEFQLAEQYFRAILEVDPNDSWAKFSLAHLYLQDKKYDEAELLFGELVQVDPTNTDYHQGLERAASEPILDQAREYETQKNYAYALSHYKNLAEEYPDNVDYVLMVGRVYTAMEQYNRALCVYEQAMEKHTDDFELIRAIGFVYLFKALEDNAYCFNLKSWRISVARDWYLCLSCQYFLRALAKEPTDSDTLAGIGRVYSLKGCQRLAEKYYLRALQSDDENTTVYHYIASLRREQKRNFSAKKNYRTLLNLDPSDEDAILGWNQTLELTKPNYWLRGYFYEEREKDRIFHDKVARLDYYGGEIGFRLPCNNCLTFNGLFIDEYIILRDLISNTRPYSYDIQRVQFGVDWNVNSCLSVTGGLRLSYSTPYHKHTFEEECDLFYEPFLGVYYSKNRHSFNLVTFGESIIVSRDFDDLEAELLQQQTLATFYEYDLGKRRSIGIEGSNSWYFDDFYNQRQLASTWIQLTPPVCWENFSLRYQFVYGRFNDLTVDYYTYQPQTTHWVKLGFTKEWCNDRFFVDFQYWHGWQRSFESGQIIQVTPIADFRWVNRDIDVGVGEIRYQYGCHFDYSLFGSISNDSFDYRTWLLSAKINWRF